MLFSPLPHIRKYLKKKLEGKVYGGPYKGMDFPENNGIDCYESKLMGIYEKELHSAISRLSNQNFDSLTIIGTAEGYHAIGLAKITGLTPLCFEEKNSSYKNLEALAKVNQTEISLNQKFTNKTTIDIKPGLIFMDIEGDEANVLTSQRLNDWKDHHVIIEIHGREILQSIIQKTAGLFTTEWIKSEKRTVNDYPFNVPMKKALARWWNVPVQEWRSDSLGWLILTPLH